MKKIIGTLAFVFVVPFSSVASGGTTGKDTAAYHHYIRGLLLEADGNFQSAREEIGRALEAAPDNAYLYRTAAELSLRLGQVNQAADEIERANEIDPKDVKSLILAGQIHWALGNADKAEAKLKKAVALAPDEAEATVSLAGTLTPRDPKRAIQLYKNFLQRHPGDVEILERLAQLYNSSGDTENARDTWEKTLSWAPGSVRAHLALAQIAEVNQDTGTAISHYEAVMTDDPTNLPLLLRVGELRYRNNEMAQAQEAFSRAKSIAPDSAAANFWMALLAENRGDWNEAITLLEKVSAEGPDAGVLLRLSYYYSQAGRYPDAVKSLEKLVETQPSNTDFLNYLAIAYEQNNQDAKAEKTLTRILEIDTNNYAARFQLATLYDRQNKIARAETELKTAISLKPDYDVALNYLGYSYADRNVHLEEAEKMLTQALSLDPQNPAYLDSIGWLYHRKGDQERAAKFLTEATERARDNLIFEHLADVRVSQGDNVAALLALHEAILADPKSKSARSKARKLMKKMTAAQKAEVFTRLSEDRFREMASIQSLVTARVCQGVCADSKATLAYTAGDQLRVEIPGPLSGPVMLLVKKKGNKSEYGAVHPDFQNAKSVVTRCFDRIDSVLSAEIFKTFDAKKLAASASEKKGRIVADAGSASVSYHAKTGELLEVRWADENGGDTLELGASTSVLPSYFLWTDRHSGVSLRVQFLKPAVVLSEPDAPAAEPAAKK